MKKNNLNSSIILLALIIIGLSVVCYFFYAQMAGAGQRITDLSEKSAQNVKYQEQMKSLEASLTTFMPQIEKIDSYFIAPSGEVAFIDQLESAATSDNLDITINSVQIVNPSKQLAGSGVDYLGLKITTNGSWSNTYRFLNEVLYMPYQIIVDSADISISSDKATTTSPLWQGTFTIRVLKKVDIGKIKT